MRILRSAVVGVVLFTGAPGMLSVGQMSQQQQTGPMRNPGLPPPIDGTRMGDTDTLPAEVMARQAQSRNNDRQKRLVEDTNKLLALATDLKQQVDKTNKDVMSVEVIKKAEEIEKLAKSVKERMKG